MRLCITADDYGLAPHVNAGINDLVAHGAICAASVMVHPDALLNDVALLRERVATGLHLVLVGERPLRPKALAPLLDTHGLLPRSYAQLFAALLRRPRLLAAVTDEIIAQIERFQSLGLSLEFINSHQHAHLFPPIWNRLVDALARTAAPQPALRAAHTGPWGGLRQSILHVSSRLAWMRRPLPNARLLMAFGVDFAGRTGLGHVDAALQRLAHAAQTNSEVLFELVMHPGLEASNVLARHAVWQYRWREEYDLLLSPDFDAMLRRYGVVRTSPSASRPSVGPL